MGFHYIMNPPRRIGNSILTKCFHHVTMDFFGVHLFYVIWSLTPNIGFQDQSSLNAGQKYCRMLQMEHSAILSTFIKPINLH